MLYPDAAQAALLSIGMLLLFRPNYELPSKVAALAAGLAFGWMIGINPTSMRFGIAVLRLGGVWFWKVEPELRIVFMRRAGVCSLGVLAMLALWGTIHSVHTGDALLLYKQLRGGGVAEASASNVDGWGALERFARGAFGPFGEFGLLSLGAAFGVILGRTRIAKEGQLILFVWLGVVVLTILVALVPQMLSNRRGAGEFSTRYVIPGMVPIVVLCGSTLVAFRNKTRRRRAVLLVAVAFSGMSLFFNHKPRMLTVGPEDALAFLRQEGERIYATPRTALQLSQLWGASVDTISEIKAEGIVVLASEELAMLERKYDRTEMPALPAGFQLGPEVKIPIPELTLWQGVADWLVDQKRSVLGRTQVVSRTKAYRIERVVP
ncbi:MAG: hypothetical protein KDB07_10160 [Planctomycetes bacterium]|nr:hypothetical protein [Planctomycetota bacterium]